MLNLTHTNRGMLDGAHGEASRFAMSVIARMAEAVGAEKLLSAEQAHIDACALMSLSSLDLVSHSASNGDRASIPQLSAWFRLVLSTGRPLEFPLDLPRSRSGLQRPI